MAKYARQSDDQPVNDAPFGADIKNAASTHAAQEKSRCGPKAKPAIEPSDIQGLKSFDQPCQGRFDSIGKTLTAFDGSVVDTIVRVARLAWLPKAGGKMNCGYRLHTQF